MSKFSKLYNKLFDYSLQQGKHIKLKDMLNYRAHANVMIPYTTKYIYKEFPIRLAKRVLDLNNLPFGLAKTTYIFDGHIDEAVDSIIAARADNGLNPDVLRSQITSYRPFFDTERTKGLPFGIQSKEDWQDAITSMEAAGIIKPGQNAEDFFTNDLLPK